MSEINENTPLCFELRDSTISATIKLYKLGSPNSINLSSTYDFITWTAFNPDKTVLTLSSGQESAFISGNTSTFSKSYTDYYYFKVLNADVNVKGNVNSLINFKNKTKELPSCCFNYLLSGCTKIVDISELILPTGNMSEYCYLSMFEGCTNILNCPKLKSVNLSKGCYQDMFAGCVSLLNMPELPGTELAESCYEGMFYGCISLSSMQILSATTLANKCYYQMFGKCINISDAPTILATTLSENSCEEMFNGCDNLSSMNVAFTDWNESQNSTTNWVSGVADTGVFTCKNELSSIFDYSHIPPNWRKNSIFTNVIKFNTIDVNDILLKKNVKKSYLEYPLLRIDKIGNPYEANLNISYDYKNWEKYNISSTGIGEVIEISGDLYISGDNQINGLSKDEYNYYNFAISGNTINRKRKLICIGNISSLINTNDISDKPYCFCKLFDGCSTLYSIPTASFDNLSEGCYQGMFKGCSSIETAFDLNSVSVKKDSYKEMFNGCESLKAVPKIAATSIESGSFESMFEGCSTIESTPDLSNIKELKPYCYNRMFKDCLNLKNITDLPASVMVDGCYQTMFENCSSLSSTPVLSSTKLADYCYGGMFQGCTSLSSTCNLPALNLKKYCYADMFEDCVSIEETNILNAISAEVGCYQAMFRGCSGLKKINSIKIENLKNNCFASMFEDCTSLSSVKIDLLRYIKEYSDRCFSRMFAGCTNLVNSPYLMIRNTLSGCYANMFDGCSSLSTITVIMSGWNDSDRIYDKSIQYAPTTKWVRGVSNHGLFRYADERLEIIRGESYIPIGWDLEDLEDKEKTKYLYFNPEDYESSYVSLIKNGSTNDISIEWSDDKIFWNTYEIGDNIYFKNNSEICLRGLNVSGISKDSKNYYYFNLSGRMNCYGNLLKIIDYKNDISEIPNLYCFYSLFKDQDNLLSMPSISANYIKAHCYEEMFMNCASLTGITELPSYNLPSSCYASMFENCISLSTAPEILAYEVEDRCCENMFYNCSALISMNCKLQANNLASHCYDEMFANCISLKYMPSLYNMKNIGEYSCNEMFSNCSSLISINNLNPTEIEKFGCSLMFTNCINLK